MSAKIQSYLGYVGKLTEDGSYSKIFSKSRYGVRFNFVET